MKIEWCSGSDEVARVYVASFAAGKWVEFVEALQRPLPRSRKWVLIVSSLFGCPVRCLMCDAGGTYAGRLNPEQILAQIDFLVGRHFPGRTVPVEKFKIQFARLGEPAYNPAVLDALDELPARFDAPGLQPSLSSVAPAGRDAFFARLREIKERRYGGERFQLQFSIHTTDAAQRDRLLPVKKWDFGRIAAYGREFRGGRGKKITLNFAPVRGMPLDEAVLLRHFDPADFLIKVTPLNPTHRGAGNGLAGRIDPWRREEEDDLFARLRRSGYEVICSIGDLEENRIGSNCGQSLLAHRNRACGLPGGYDYPRQEPERSEKEANA